MSTSDKIDVLLVDDHAVVREGYKRLLEKRGDISVVGEADNGADAYERFCKLQPQVVVLDIALPASAASKRCDACSPGAARRVC